MKHYRQPDPSYKTRLKNLMTELDGSRINDTKPNPTDALAHLLSAEISECPNLLSTGKSVEDELISREDEAYSDRSIKQLQFEKLFTSANKILTEQEFIFLVSRYMRMTDSMIARAHNVTPTRVHKVLAMVTKKLQEYFHKEPRKHAGKIKRHK